MYEKTLNIIPNGVLMVDTVSKNITIANKEMENIVK